MVNICELADKMDNEKNNDTNRFSFLEYQLVAQLWASEWVNDGLYQIIYDTTQEMVGLNCADTLGCAVAAHVFLAYGTPFELPPMVVRVIRPCRICASIFACADAHPQGGVHRVLQSM